jgi:hypothetical protein
VQDVVVGAIGRHQHNHVSEADLDGAATSFLPFEWPICNVDPDLSAPLLPGCSRFFRGDFLHRFSLNLWG